MSSIMEPSKMEYAVQWGFLLKFPRLGGTITQRGARGTEERRTTALRCSLVRSLFVDGSWERASERRLKNLSRFPLPASRFAEWMKRKERTAKGAEAEVEAAAAPAPLASPLSVARGQIL